MKGNKILYLLLALVLPGVVFVFLKMFGRNEFQVSPLFQEGTITLEGACAGQPETPYSLPDSTRDTYGLRKNPFTVVCFSDTLAPSWIRSVEEATGREQVTFQCVYSENVFLTRADSGSSIMLTDEQFLRDRNCVFLLSKEQDVVLADSSGTIFGQYDSRDLDEIDRLKAEVLIVLKKY